MSATHKTTTKADERRHVKSALQHSPLPFTYSAIGGDNFILSKGVPIAEVLYDEMAERITIEEMDANKAFMVHACNNAQRLADALEAIRETGRDMANGGIAITHEAYTAATEALAQWEADQ